MMKSLKKNLFKFGFVILLTVFLVGCKTVDYEKIADDAYSKLTFPTETKENVNFVLEDVIEGYSIVYSYTPDNDAIDSNGTIKRGETDKDVLITINILVSENSEVKFTKTYSVTIKVLKVGSFVIEYDLDGGICQNLVTDFEEFDTVTLPTPTKVGHTFLGWYEGENLVTTVTSKNYSLVAKWEKLSYSIVYNLDGGTCSDLVTSAFYGETITLPVPVKDGYTFTGWSLNGGIVSTVTITDNTSSTLEITALWKEENVGGSLVITKDVDECVVGSDAYISISGVSEFDFGKFTWVSSDEEVATIDEFYFVVFHKKGNAVITITSKADPSVYGTLEIEVVNKVPRLAISQKIILVGEEFTIDVTNYSDISLFEIVLDNSGVLRYDSTQNKYVAQKEGTSIVRYKLLDDDIYSEVEVTVYPIAPLLFCDRLTLTVNETTRLDILNYSDPTAYEITALEEGCVEINGRLITALKQTTVTIKVTLASDSEIYSTIEFTINPICPVAQSSVSNLLVGGQSRFLITNLGELESTNLTDYNVVITPSTVASINSDYIITAHSIGVATVTVTSKTNSLVTSSFQIEVSKTSEVKDANGEVGFGSLFLTLKETNGYVKAGEIDYVLIDQAKDYNNYLFASDNTSVLAVYENGRFATVSAGFATVFVRNKSNNEIFGTITIEVYGTPNVNYIDRLIKIAEGELGIVEGPNNDTKYGTWYGLPNEAWCAMFVSWCANQSGISTSVIPKYASVTTGMEWFIKEGRFEYKESYTPKAGDIIFFKSDGASHTGIVINCEGNTVYTIEGNTSNMVAKRQYTLNYRTITGYGLPNYPEYDGTIEGGSTEGSTEGGGQTTT